MTFLYINSFREGADLSLRRFAASSIFKDDSERESLTAVIDEARKIGGGVLSKGKFCLD